LIEGFDRVLHVDYSNSVGSSKRMEANSKFWKRKEIFFERELWL